MYIRTHISLSCLSSPPPTSTLPHRYPSHTLFSPSLLPHTHIFVPRVVCVACSSYGCSRAIPFLNHLSIDAQWGHRHKHQLPPRPTPPHTHSLPLLSFTTFMSSNLPPLQTAYTILDSRGAGKGCHHHHLHHSLTSFPLRGGWREAFSFAFAFAFAFSSFSSPNTKMLLSRCVCVRISPDSP